MTRLATFLRAILSGPSLPGEVQTRHGWRKVAGSDLDRMRGDVERVGRLFGGVMPRELGKANVAQHQPKPPHKRHPTP